MFGSTMTLEDLDHKKYLFQDAMNQNADRVINRLDRHHLSINNYLDDCGQNLLHVSVRCGNYEFSKRLLLRGVDVKKINCFGETPLDVAVQRNDVALVKLLLNEDNQAFKEELKFTKNENGRLKEKNEDLEKTNKKLLDTNSDLTRRWNIETVRADVEMNSRKRLRSDLDDCQRDNKRLKTENDTLKIDNNILKDTVNNLRNKHKK